MFDHRPPELAPYLDEPKQLPSGSFGKSGFLHLGFERRGQRTILAESYRRAPLIVQRALYCDEELPDMPNVFIISNSGGILQGDRYKLEIHCAPDTQAHVTTQAATKIHEMDANYASQDQEIVLGDGAYLEYVPDASIPHRHTRFLSRTRISIAASATLLYSEVIAGGRKYYRGGELFEYDLFSSWLRAERPDSRELFVEKFLVEPRQRPVRQAGVMGSFDVFANVLVLLPAKHIEAIASQAPAQFSLAEGWAAGASRLPNDAGLVYKIVGSEIQQVRQIVRGLWAIVRQQVLGVRVPRPFPWS